MGYVDKNLMSSEQIVYKAKLHWFIFVPGIVFFVVGSVLISNDMPGSSAPVFGVILVFLAIILLIRAFIQKISTELAVTSKRVVAKIGLVRRSTIELNHAKVESFNVDQSVLGRVFGFGTLVINGTGGGKTPIPNIDAPLDFRRKAMESIDANQSE